LYGNKNAVIKVTTTNYVDIVAYVSANCTITSVTGANLISGNQYKTLVSVGQNVVTIVSEGQTYTITINKVATLNKLLVAGPGLSATYVTFDGNRNATLPVSTSTSYISMVPTTSAGATVSSVSGTGSQIGNTYSRIINVGQTVIEINVNGTVYTLTVTKAPLVRVAIAGPNFAPAMYYPNANNEIVIHPNFSTTKSLNFSFYTVSATPEITVSGTANATGKTGYTNFSRKLESYDQQYTVMVDGVEYTIIVDSIV